MMDKIIGYTAGVYDMFHIGHLNILREARKRCDFLIVAVSTDELVKKEKGKMPIVPFSERKEIVQSIRYVDQVVPQPDKDKLAAWRRYRFDIMFVGSDWQGTPQWNQYETELSPHGVIIQYLPHTEGVSSTILMRFIKYRYNLNGNYRS